MKEYKVEEGTVTIGDACYIFRNIAFITDEYTDEAIETLLDTGSYGTADIAKRVAIETMRKYQKIEEIVKFGNANELGFEYVGEKITEVLEDGNV